MSISRRGFLNIGSTTALALLTGCGEATESLLTQIKNRPQRRDITTLGDNHPILAAWRDAIQQMQALPMSDPRNWTNQANIHNLHCPHGNWLWLPWHRAYLYYLEEICRELTGMQEFALPYWNWTKDPQIPAVFWGDANNPLWHQNRTATANSMTSQNVVGASAVDGLLDEDNFMVFGSGSIGANANQRTFVAYGTLEGTPHNYIHSFVGGTMSIFTAPLDPVFWAHHNMVELCWVDWNLERGHPNTNDSAWMQRVFEDFVDGEGDPVSISVEDTLLMPLLGYRYDATVAGNAIADLGVLSEAQLGAMRQFLLLGATIAFENMMSLERRGPMTVELSSPGVVKLDGERALQVLAQQGDARLLLILDGVSLDHDEDFFVRVFVDKPDAGPSTPTTDPGYVGSFAFFAGAHVMMHGHGSAGHGHGDEPGRSGGRFVLD
ncbi:MAG: hypothetical protein HC927_07050, partial [Deltaproteobacteria bacterium]|nr:hypothetical protein [Deltaproteobacteria bacterium]